VANLSIHPMMNTHQQLQKPLDYSQAFETSRIFIMAGNVIM